MLWHHKHQTYAQKVKYANKTVWHARHAIKWLTANRRFLSRNVGSGYWARSLKDHRWLLRFGLKMKRDLYLQSLPPHYNGWICIHNGEATWHDTGDPYWGGLQMTPNWMRSIGGINGYASNYTPLQQMWAAERVSRRYGFSYDWMHGQWPISYLSCTRYF